ncbi:unnamed protein product [Thlaspi arvense]|uniref:Uncharacterized protein n=1 Tax=Thlaspi arvense TaxID=13288 RepID=A0AAU9T8K5_THLAR|nr:unnamed protein product [Thlaspi arvense]
MSEQGGDESSDKPCFPTTTLAAVLLDSFNIFLKNLPLYLYIFFFTTLPLSFLLFSLSLSSRPVTTLVRHLEALALLAPTRFESRHLWKESRREAVSLLRLRALYLLPSYALSITAATSAVASAAAALSGKRPTLATAAAAVRLTWKRTLATSICVYGIMMGYC